MRLPMTLLLVCLAFASCQKDTGTGPLTLPEKSAQNVAYGTDPQQQMDYYLPADRSTGTTRVIIMIHGGAWTQGDKSEFTAYMDTLKKRMPGYALFNINYRLATGTANFFPTQEEDVKTAVEFIYGKRDEYGISDKFVLLGASAGGHLSLLQAYKHTSPVRIRAVVDFFGPTELVSMYNNPPNPLIPLLLSQVLGGSPVTQATLYQQSSPLNFVTAQCPPTIILHGGADIVVSPSQSVMLKDQLTASGVVNQYVFYPTENHGWTGLNLTDSFDKVQAFLQANVN